LSFLRKVLAIVAKDIAAELRTREMLSAMLVFSLLVLLIFSFALDLRGAMARAVAPGVLWATFCFAGTLGLGRSLVQEQDAGCLDGLLLAPVDPSAIFFGKALGNALFMAVVEVIVLPLFAALFNVPLLRPQVVPVLVLGTVGYAAVGTLLAAIAVNTRAREVMLPVLLFPLAVPILIAVVKATGGVAEGLGMADIAPWLRLLVAYDVIIIAVCFAAFGYVVEE